MQGQQAEVQALAHRDDHVAAAVPGGLGELQGPAVGDGEGCQVGHGHLHDLAGVGEAVAALVGGVVVAGEVEGHCAGSAADISLSALPGTGHRSMQESTNHIV